MAIADHGMIPREEMLQITKYCGISLSKLYRMVDDFKGQYAPNAWENAEKVYHRHRNYEDVLKPKKIILPPQEDIVSIPPNFCMTVEKFTKLFDTFKSVSSPDKIIAQKFGTSSAAIKAA